LVTKGDIIETYFKLKQRGIEYVFSKFSIDKNTRVKSTFNHINIESSNYWIIPEIKKHWNKIITGNPQQEYADYVIGKYFKKNTGLKMLSLGCGAGSHEIKFAKHSNFSEITGIDLATKLIDEANRSAEQLHYTNLKYEVADIYQCNFDIEYFDAVLFHSSLHHFKNLDTLLGDIIKKTLKKDGLLIIHEYVGPDRIQWTDDQLQEVKTILSTFPVNYKKRYKLNAIKTKAYRAGKLRMIISDPSEAVESSAILPTIHQYFKTDEEKGLGGNLLMPLFKDISHHFIDDSEKTKALLQYAFQEEAKFLKTHESDFVFGVYRNT